MTASKGGGEENIGDREPAYFGWEKEDEVGNHISAQYSKFN